MQNTFRVNNFDMIRLIAALQVAIYHIIVHLDIAHSHSVILTILSYFPGVPIFFFVSGFLISRSYESNSFINEYTHNRILRIYPALIVCTFISLFSVYLTGYFASVDFSIFEFVAWVIGQISFIQFYNPEFMREFGIGVLNGSLWTICVELQFYILIPVIYWIFSVINKKKTNYNLLILIFIFTIFHALKYNFYDEYSEKIMFLVGVFFQKNFITLHKALSGKVFYLFLFYLSASYFSVEYIGWSLGNGINPILYLFLAVLIFSFAYSFPKLSQKIFKGNDISYGVYIYHAPILNVLMYYGYTAKTLYAIVAIITLLLFAVVSWFCIEKNCLKLKKHPLNPLNSTIGIGHPVIEELSHNT